MLIYASVLLKPSCIIAAKHVAKVTWMFLPAQMSTTNLSSWRTRGDLLLKDWTAAILDSRVYQTHSGYFAAHMNMLAGMILRWSHVIIVCTCQRQLSWLPVCYHVLYKLCDGCTSSIMVKLLHTSVNWLTPWPLTMHRTLFHMHNILYCTSLTHDVLLDPQLIKVSSVYELWAVSILKNLLKRQVR